MRMLPDFFRVRASIAKDGYRFFTALPSNGRQFHRIGGNAVTESLPFSRIGKIPPVPGRNPAGASALQVREAAVRLEASFLAEMLKQAGFGPQQGQFGGGIGEEQFASFHREAIAQRMSEAGGIGLAEHFFRAMMEKQDDT